MSGNSQAALLPVAVTTCWLALQHSPCHDVRDVLSIQPVASTRCTLPQETTFCSSALGARSVSALPTRQASLSSLKFQQRSPHNIHFLRARLLVRLLRPSVSFSPLANLLTPKHELAARSAPRRSPSLHIVFAAGLWPRAIRIRFYSLLARVVRSKAERAPSAKRPDVCHTVSSARQRVFFWRFFFFALVSFNMCVEAQ